MVSKLDDLLKAQAYPHRVKQIRLIETHISWVLLTGPFAYKIKKPVRLPFLDFSSLERRRHFCHEELRLNKRLAPQLYIDVVTINSLDGKLSFCDGGNTVDYAVKMHEFPSTARLDQLLDKDQLHRSVLSECADYIFSYFCKADTSSSVGFGTPELVTAPVMDNLSELRSLGVSKSGCRSLIQGERTTKPFTS